MPIYAAQLKRDHHFWIHNIGVGHSCRELERGCRNIEDVDDVDPAFIQRSGLYKLPAPEESPSLGALMRSAGKLEFAGNPFIAHFDVLLQERGIPEPGANAHLR